MKFVTTNQNRGWPTTVVGAWAMAVMLWGTAASAQPYTLEWSNTDGSAAASSGGAFTVTSTIGQPDAASLAGGDYVLAGGFWPALIVPSENAPTLTIRFFEGELAIVWSPATPSFTLEMTDDLGDGSWVPAPNPDANPSVIVPDGATRFFRLVEEH